MRRHAITLVAVSVAAANAHAQSSITMFGFLDAGITYVSNQGGHSNTLLDTGVWAPSLFGLSGAEDLGGGTKAIFMLESQFDMANGSTIPSAGALFARQAWVGLSDPRLGDITAGNQHDFMWESLLFGGFHDQNAGFDGSLFYGGFYNFRQGPFSALGIPNNATGSSDFDRVAGSSRVSNSVKYKSPDFSGFTFGALYGFGQVAGDFSSSNSVSFGANYSRGPFAVGAAYTEVKYPQMNNGHDGIRNYGVGMHYNFAGIVLANVLYTNTKNTLTGARIDVGQIGANWFISNVWTLGANYEYMKGNETLLNNKAHQVTGALMYWFSKRTAVYLEGVYQHASGDNPDTGAWINGLFGPTAASSSHSQTIGRLGLTTAF
ncbi:MULTISPECIES: porin [Burkholderia]|uniref:Outer membrane porin n=1 Tax=Burkholderia aenigmatica TaxID=2015348 RepID=A0ABY6XQX9_9BURK|nr:MULTISPECIES: porin [Burkholderia]VWC66826.1 outer membrane porin [Burkholderia aenigmatica]VWC91129.1 outer membrane porin [Burkholderia aenigmatica]